MVTPVKKPDKLDSGSHHRTADELVHIIRKLRWIGMDDEAEVMQTQLAASRVSPGDNVIGGPRDTD